ncbi:hypothetical protein QYM36_011181 [Artemia franciscana]|uniref:Uncharacterized protein n=1 Tax=Artemia franciscana TaxID=6661 RepID=A0AA88L492_ARTSF|nr:hypothetical protein QYM36_011181 [Artemia franciscana]
MKIRHFLLLRREFFSSVPKLDNSKKTLIYGTWFNTEMKRKLEDSLVVVNDFITEEEETSLMKEVGPYLEKLIYEKDHWDDVSKIRLSMDSERLKDFIGQRQTLQFLTGLKN